MAAPIKIGFVGYGGSAKNFHLPYILPNSDLEIYAFLQRAEAPANPSSATPGSHCTVDFPKAKHHQTADAFFGDPNIEQVIVCSHTDSRGEFAEKALRAGKHVVVEKPFTTSSEEASRLIAISKETGKLLTVFQNRRYDGDFKTLRHLIENDALGTITEAEMHYDFENPPWLHYMSDKKYTPGQGMMFGLGSHSIDQAILLFGQPKSVTGFLRDLRAADSEIEDTFTIVLQYDSPLLVTIKTTIISPMEEPLKYLIRGQKGAYMKFGTDAQEEHAISGMSATDPKLGVEPDSLHGLLTTYAEFDSKSQKYDAQRKKYIGRYPTITGRICGYYEDVVSAIRGEAPLQVLPEQSRDGIRVMELARISQESGSTVPWG